MSINTLYNRVSSGDPGSEDRLFENLRDRFSLFVQQRIWSEQDAEDVVQESLVSIAGKYKEIVFETSFAAWAYKVLENKILEYYRKKRCRDSKFSQMANDDSSTGQDGVDCTLRGRLLDCLKKINEVSNRYARVLNLQYQGYTTKEICDRLDVTRNGLYIVLSRARSMLRLCLHKGDIE